MHLLANKEYPLIFYLFEKNVGFFVGPVLHVEIYMEGTFSQSHYTLWHILQNI